MLGSQSVDGFDVIMTAQDVQRWQLRLVITYVDPGSHVHSSESRRNYFIILFQS